MKGEALSTSSPPKTPEKLEHDDSLRTLQANSEVSTPPSDRGKARQFDSPPSEAERPKEELEDQVSTRSEPPAKRRKKNSNKGHQLTRNDNVTMAQLHDWTNQFHISLLGSFVKHDLVPARFQIKAFTRRLADIVQLRESELSNGNKHFVRCDPCRVLDIRCFAPITQPGPLERPTGCTQCNLTNERCTYNGDVEERCQYRGESRLSEIPDSHRESAIRNHTVGRSERRLLDREGLTVQDFLALLSQLSMCMSVSECSADTLIAFSSGYVEDRHLTSAQLTTIGKALRLIPYNDVADPKFSLLTLFFIS